MLLQHNTSLITASDTSLITASDMSRIDEEVPPNRTIAMPGQSVPVVSGGMMGGKPNQIGMSQPVVSNGWSPVGSHTCSSSLLVLLNILF